MMKTKTLTYVLFVLAAVSSGVGPLQAEMVLSQVIIDLLPGEPMRDDIEVWNTGEERMYVSAEPFEVIHPGTSSEQRIAANPEQSDILVSPRRLVLEPGERRTVRIAAIGERPSSDRIYRIAIKPVAGAVSADQSALKVFIGYDTLVIVRPSAITGNVESERRGRTLWLHNGGNSAYEMYDGRQCDVSGSNCLALPAKRLYAGATWEQSVPFDTPVTYKLSIGPSVIERQF